MNPYEPPLDPNSHRTERVYSRYPKCALAILALTLLMPAISLPHAFRSFYTLGDANNLRFIVLFIGAIVIVAFCAYGERKWGRRGLLAIPIILSPLILTTTMAFASLIPANPAETIAQIRNDPWLTIQMLFLFAVHCYTFLIVRRSLSLLLPRKPKAEVAGG